MAIYLPYWLPEFGGDYIQFAALSIRPIFFGYFHLWYLAGMIGAAIVLLVLLKAGTRILIAAAILALLAGVAIQYAANYNLIGNGVLRDLANRAPSHRNFLLLSFPFFCAGFLINKYQLHRHINFRSALIAAAGGVALLLVELWIQPVDATHS